MTQRRVGKQNRIAVYTAQYREMIILAVFQIHDDGDLQLCKLLERQGIAFRFKTPGIMRRISSNDAGICSLSSFFNTSSSVSFCP
ncbi:hypothetical protein NMNM126_0683 [Neisseria meningitidis NM126]|nr:hypothetical protein NMNM126_0683 [Neisseria meningitidis NM126]